MKVVQIINSLVVVTLLVIVIKIVDIIIYAISFVQVVKITHKFVCIICVIMVVKCFGPPVVVNILHGIVMWVLIVKVLS